MVRFISVVDRVFNAEYSVVVLPLPVGPVTSISPYGAEINELKMENEKLNDLEERLNTLEQRLTLVKGQLTNSTTSVANSKGQTSR